MCAFGSNQLVSSSVPALMNVNSGIAVASVVMGEPDRINSRRSVDASHTSQLNNQDR
jgi:hypothetical protein